MVLCDRNARVVPICWPPGMAAQITPRIVMKFNQWVVFKLMFGPVLEPHAQYPELFEASRQTFILIHAIVKQGVESGIFRQDDVEYLTNAAWAGVHGIVTLKLDRSELFDRHIIDLDRQVNTSVDIFLAGIKNIS